MRNALINAGIMVQGKKEKLVSKVKNFIKEEKSGKGVTEEGYLMYGAIAVGILMLALIIGFLTGGFEAIGNFFRDGVSGDNTNPNGWGN
jgi:hypothetical protein